MSIIPVLRRACNKSTRFFPFRPAFLFDIIKKSQKAELSVIFVILLKILRLHDADPIDLQRLRLEQGADRRLLRGLRAEGNAAVAAE